MTSHGQRTDDLQAEIEARAREIHTDRYSMSINEMVTMYEDRDLEVHPEFQRIFRWSIDQQSRLIESIFLGIPIPPVFVAQRPDGVWDVVDGVQRLSTVLRFMGVLKKVDGSPDPAVPLAAGEYIEGLKGVTYDDATGAKSIASTPLALNDAQKRSFKRARFDFQIVQKESDEQAKYDLFQRLNSGTRLSEQEARNCLAVMLDASFASWLESLAQAPHYMEVVDLSERKEQEAYGTETVLRFLACALTPMNELQKMGDVGEFLTNSMKSYIRSSSFSRKEEEQRFNFVFSELEASLGSDAFKRYNPANDRFLGKFSVSAFEAIASGLALHWRSWVTVGEAERREHFIKATKAVWKDPVFAERAGGGKPANRRIPFMVQVGTRLFDPATSL